MANLISLPPEIAWPIQPTTGRRRGNKTKTCIVYDMPLLWKGLSAENVYIGNVRKLTKTKLFTYERRCEIIQFSKCLKSFEGIKSITSFTISV